jgi:hypothetical protein
VHINGTRYAFSYDHAHQQVVIKRGGQQGKVIASFDNKSGNRNVVQKLKNL